jgi:hypothetical protein
MEDVRAVYTRPGDPDRNWRRAGLPAGLTSKQLLAETRVPIR